jgi:heme/copper-type cytochrome/quinol oxidase subunit 2
VTRNTLQSAARSMLSLSLCLALFPALAPIACAQDQAAQIIELTAKKYEFLPSPLHVKKGQKIQLKVTASDHDHGIKMPLVPDGADKTGAPGLIFSSSEDCWKIKKGETVMIEFVAKTPGTYTFKCCVDCGLGHRHMRGQIIVDD